MNKEEVELFDRIMEFSIDEGDEQFTFMRRLARDNGWTYRFADRVIEEYKKFVFLGMVAGHPVTPSDQVDQAWHLHLTYSRSYWDRFCGEVLGKPFHHGPTKGGSDEGKKYWEWYSKTLESYETWFGEKPPQDIWSPPEIRFGEDLNFQRVNTEKSTLEKEIPTKWLIITAIMLSILFIILIVIGLRPFPDSLFIVMIVTWTLIGLSFQFYSHECPSCGKSFALKASGNVETNPANKLKRYEYVCKNCGYAKWIDKTKWSGGFGGSNDGGCGGGCGGGGCGGG